MSAMKLAAHRALNPGLGNGPGINICPKIKNGVLLMNKQSHYDDIWEGDTIEYMGQGRGQQEVSGLNKSLVEDITKNMYRPYEVLMKTDHKDNLWTSVGQFFVNSYCIDTIGGRRVVFFDCIKIRIPRNPCRDTGVILTWVLVAIAVFAFLYKRVLYLA